MSDIEVTKEDDDAANAALSGWASMTGAETYDAVRLALATARHRAAEEMRERAARVADESDPFRHDARWVARAIRALSTAPNGG